MSKRSVKSLHRPGRVSRKRASKVARSLRAELESGALKVRGLDGKKIAVRTTASGRNAVSFKMMPSKTASSAKGNSARKTAAG